MGEPQQGGTQRRGTFAVSLDAGSSNIGGNVHGNCGYACILTIATNGCIILRLDLFPGALNMRGALGYFVIIRGSFVGCYQLLRNDAISFAAHLPSRRGTTLAFNRGRQEGSPESPIGASSSEFM